MDKNTRINVLLAHVYEKKKYKNGERLTICNVLIYPRLNDDKFDSVEYKDYKWENREFKYPLFSKFKKENIFLIENSVSYNEAYFKTIENKSTLVKAKQAKVGWDEWMTEQWDKFKDSDLFDTPLNKKIDI